MRSQIVLLCTLAALFLAGCTANPTDTGDADLPTESEETPTALEPRTRLITLTDCAIIEVFVRIDAEEVEDAGVIPPAFTLPVIGSEALAVMGTNRCTTENGTLERMFLAFQVEVNEPALDPGPDVNVFYEPEHVVVNGTDFANVLAVLHGNASVASAMQVDMALLDSSATADIATGQHALRATQVDATGEPGRGFGRFREYFPGQGGYSYFEATYSADVGAYGTGTGTVLTAPNTVSRTLLGEERPGASITATGTTLEDAFVGFIPM